MLGEKWISNADYERAIKQSVKFHYGQIPTSPYSFALTVIRREVLQQLGEGAIRRGGLKIYCELDPAMQQQAERAAVRGAAALRSRYSWIAEMGREQPLQVAILSVDPRDGGIRAVVGGSDARISSFDRTVQMKRQPGSAFKTFTFLSAIEKKKATTSTLLVDAPITVRLPNGEAWEPHNYDEMYRGRVTVRQAFEKSLNVPTIRLAERVGTQSVVNVAKRFGFEEKFDNVPALPLGVTEVTMRELTAAYTAFPNLGRRVQPFVLSKVVNHRGHTIYEHELEEDKVAAPAAAYVMHSLLRGVVQRGTASRLKRYGLGFVAGKTGTTNSYRDAWFVGYARNLVTTVWVGFDSGAPLRLSSAEAAIPVWGSYMRNVKLDESQPVVPSGVVFRDIDPESGFLWQEGCPGPVREPFLSGTAPTHHCPSGLAGRVLRRILFDSDAFDEPPAITFEKFRRWTEEIDRSRQEVEGRLDRIRRTLEGDRKREER
jgi:penicillin-binding protein 1B